MVFVAHGSLQILGANCFLVTRFAGLGYPTLGVFVGSDLHLARHRSWRLVVLWGALRTNRRPRHRRRRSVSFSSRRLMR